MLCKLSRIDQVETYEPIHGKVWQREATTGPFRMAIGCDSNQIDVMLSIASLWPGPIGLLYVLLTPRKDHKSGRYQWPYQLSHEETNSVMRKYQSFFERDGRHHIWLRCTSTKRLVVYDQHNIIFAYGPLEEYETLLKKEHFHEGIVSIPDPHVHYYHSENDAFEDKLLEGSEWIHSTLKENDEY